MIAADRPFDHGKWSELDVIRTFWGDKPHPKQVRYVLCGAPQVAYCAGIRSGKTWAGTLKLFLTCLLNPKTNHLLGGRTGRDLAQTLLPQFWQHVETYAEARGFSPIAKHHKGEQVIEFYNGSRLYARPYQMADKLRGLTLGSAFLDEVDHASNPNHCFDVVMGRLSDSRCVPRTLHVATSPNGLGGVCGRFYRERCKWEAANPETRGPLQWVAFHSPIWENPHLSPAFIENLKAGYSPRLWKQEGEGMLLSPSDIVFPEVNADSNHVIPFRWRHDWPWVLGIDWGTNAAAAVAVQINPSTGQWVVADELIQQDGSFFHFRDRIQEFVASKRAPVLAVGDRAVKSENNWLRGWLGHVCDVRTCRTRTEQDLVRGLEMLRYMLAPGEDVPPRLVMADTLQRKPGDLGPMGIRDAFLNYSYKRRDGVLTNQPQDAPHDPAKHILDALRMLIVLTAHEPDHHGGEVLPFLRSEELKGS